MLVDSGKPKSGLGWLEKLLPKNALIVATAATLLVSGTSAYTIWRLQSSQSEASQAPVVVVPQIKVVTALGRLEPQGEVLTISAPASAEGSRVEQLLVKQGDRVKAGQEIAILDSRDRLAASLLEAQEQVKVAQANLEKVLAGAKKGEVEAQKATIARISAERENEIAAQKATIARINAERESEIAAQKATIARINAERESEIAAQKATIARLEAELSNAQTEYKRYELLYKDGAISASAKDSKSLTLAAAQARIKEAQANLNKIEASQFEQLKEAEANLTKITSSKAQQLKEAEANLTKITAGKQEQENEAKATLERIAEVRPVDVEIAKAEVSQAEATVKRAQANLETAYVRSPRDAQILKVHTKAGELVSNEGIVELGETNKMYAVAEVYESDINKVKLGQKVRVKSDSITEELPGTVEQIGLQVKKQNVINTDPSANIDNRVVEVKIKLDDAASQKVAGLTNLQVNVEIEL
ncbi:ABC exporter membrane fusion protein [Phormidium sp. LEGE 05292]|uniref:ABC exporter membrane fusion protein n=1 Tax=[Phormidium] sp. LEGE 05292 TaxID=767427 RepID=UPI00187F929E|nr:ABC exporter membrane fusion protein [Phormidium sp. LEGE 05292]MBE9224393.1 ABC exporter membrane fusion protein [Phormidium sp. LEGE 05292]